MPRKQAIATEATPPVKRSPRVKSAKHRSAPVENIPETIAAVAYGYWEARGQQGGDPLDDWLRAENEIRNRIQ